MEFINLTEHQINVLNAQDEVVLSLPGAAKENVLRAKVQYSPVGEYNGIQTFESTFGALVNIPPERAEYQDQVMYICSLIAAQAMRGVGRKDICSPGELVRYPKDHPVEALRGQPRGCRGLVIG